MYAPVNVKAINKYYVMRRERERRDGERRFVQAPHFRERSFARARVLSEKKSLHGIT
jgi:hypothetical protein